MNSQFFATGRIYSKKWHLRPLRSRFRPLRSRFGPLRSRPDLLCNPFKIAVSKGSGIVELKLNAHRRTFDLTIECKNRIRKRNASLISEGVLVLAPPNN